MFMRHPQGKLEQIACSVTAHYTASVPCFTWLKPIRLRSLTTQQLQNKYTTSNIQMIVIDYLQNFYRLYTTYIYIYTYMYHIINFLETSLLDYMENTSKTGQLQAIACSYLCSISGFAFHTQTAYLSNDEGQVSCWVGRDVDMETAGQSADQGRLMRTHFDLESETHT